MWNWEDQGIGLRFWIEKADRGVYEQLERFHYRKGKPVAWVGVYGCWGIGTDQANGEARLVGCATISMPSIRSHEREKRWLWKLEDRLAGKLAGPGTKSCEKNLERFKNGISDEALCWLNQNVRVISRVIVHPQFRSLGIARRLVECLLGNLDYPVIESFAVMGRFHPFFEKAGMKARVPADLRKPVYYYKMKRGALASRKFAGLRKVR